jgi:hypothetical protein
MRWSQLKKRIEETFADRVKGRVEVFVTRYRHAHDAAGEAWIVIDGQQIACMGEIRHWKRRLPIYRQLDRAQRLASPEERRLLPAPFFEAKRLTNAEGFFSDEDVKKALFCHLNLPFDDILRSDDPIIHAFGMLDKRLGKRRLAAIDTKKEAALARRLHTFRCEVEGVTPSISAPEYS